MRVIRQLVAATVAAAGVAADTSDDGGGAGDFRISEGIGDPFQVLNPSEWRPPRVPFIYLKTGDGAASPPIAPAATALAPPAAVAPTKPLPDQAMLSPSQDPARPDLDPFLADQVPGREFELWPAGEANLWIVGGPGAETGGSRAGDLEPPPTRPPLRWETVDPVAAAPAPAAALGANAVLHGAPVTTAAPARKQRIVRPPLQWEVVGPTKDPATDHPEPAAATPPTAALLAALAPEPPVARTPAAAPPPPPALPFYPPAAITTTAGSPPFPAAAGAASAPPFPGAARAPAPPAAAALPPLPSRSSPRSPAASPTPPPPPASPPVRPPSRAAGVRLPPPRPVPFSSDDNFWHFDPSSGWKYVGGTWTVVNVPDAEMPSTPPAESEPPKTAAAAPGAAEPPRAAASASQAEPSAATVAAPLTPPPAAAATPSTHEGEQPLPGAPGETAAMHRLPHGALEEPEAAKTAAKLPPAPPSAIPTAAPPSALLPALPSAPPSALPSALPSGPPPPVPAALPPPPAAAPPPVPAAERTPSPPWPEAGAFDFFGRPLPFDVYGSPLPAGVMDPAYTLECTRSDAARVPTPAPQVDRLVMGGAAADGGEGDRREGVFFVAPPVVPTPYDLAGDPSAATGGPEAAGAAAAPPAVSPAAGAEPSSDAAAGAAAATAGGSGGAADAATAAAAAAAAVARAEWRPPVYEDFVEPVELGEPRNIFIVNQVNTPPPTAPPPQPGARRPFVTAKPVKPKKFEWVVVDGSGGEGATTPKPFLLPMFYEPPPPAAAGGGAGGGGGEAGGGGGEAGGGGFSRAAGDSTPDDAEPGSGAAAAAASSADSFFAPGSQAGAGGAVGGAGGAVGGGGAGAVGGSPAYISGSSFVDRAASGWGGGAGGPGGGSAGRAGDGYGGVSTPGSGAGGGGDEFYSFGGGGTASQSGEAAASQSGEVAASRSGFAGGFASDVPVPPSGFAASGFAAAGGGFAAAGGAGATFGEALPTLDEVAQYLQPGVLLNGYSGDSAEDDPEFIEVIGEVPGVQAGVKYSEAASPLRIPGAERRVRVGGTKGVRDGLLPGTAEDAAGGGAGAGAGGASGAGRAGFWEASAHDAAAGGGAGGGRAGGGGAGSGVADNGLAGAAAGGVGFGTPLSTPTLGSGARPDPPAGICVYCYPFVYDEVTEKCGRAAEMPGVDCVYLPLMMEIQARHEPVYYAKIAQLRARTGLRVVGVAYDNPDWELIAGILRDNSGLFSGVIIEWVGPRACVKDMRRPSAAQLAAVREFTADSTLRYFMRDQNVTKCGVPQPVLLRPGPPTPPGANTLPFPDFVQPAFACYAGQEGLCYKTFAKYPEIACDSNLQRFSFNPYEGVGGRLMHLVNETCRGMPPHDLYGVL